LTHSEREDLPTTAANILVADDDPLYRLLLERSARAWGYRPVVVCDGAEAWSALAQPDGPRIALLDWVMPGMDGLEVCRRIRRAGLPHYIYLILLTAKTEPHDLIAGLEAGADEFVGKPVKLEQLRLRVKTGERIVDARTRRRAPDQSEMLLEQLRRVSAGLFRTQEEERSRIARELHEGVAQDLSSVLMQLGVAGYAPPERREEILQRVASTTESTIRSVRSLAYALYPLLLDEIGLVAALQHYAGAMWSDRNTEIELVLAAGFGRVDVDVERALFRIAQEAVANAKKRSSGARTVIHLCREGNDVLLEVRHEVCGFRQPEPDEPAVTEAAERVEILSMRERAEQAGGRLEFRSSEGGMTVRAVLPSHPRS
jgi:signal transduction histidine kinase